MTRAKFDGNFYSFQHSGEADNFVTFEFDNPASNGPSSGCDIAISGSLNGGNGTFLEAAGAQIMNIDLANLRIANWGNSSTIDTYYAVDINAPRARVKITAASFVTNSVDAKATGIRFSAALSTVITGVGFDNVNRPLDITGNSGRVIVCGVTTTNTQSAYACYGTWVTICNLLLVVLLNQTQPLTEPIVSALCGQTT